MRKFFFEDMVFWLFPPMMLAAYAAGGMLWLGIVGLAFIPLQILSFGYLERRLTVAKEDLRRLRAEIEGMRAESLLKDLPHLIRVAQLISARIARGVDDAAQLHRLRVDLVERILRVLVRVNPTYQEMAGLLNLDPIVLRDVVERRLDTSSRDAASGRHERVHLDSLDLLLYRRGTEEWSAPLLKFARSSSSLVPDARLDAWEASKYEACGWA